MKKARRNRRIFVTFLLSYLSILLFMLSCCMIFAGKISRQLFQETVMLKKSLVSSMEENVENDLENLLEYTNDLSFDQELILAIQHMDVYSTSDLSRILANRGRLSNYMHDAFLYLPQSDKVVTASICMGAEQFFSIIYQLDDLPSFRSQCLEDYQFRAFREPVTLQQYGGGQNMELLPFIQSLPISRFQEPAAQLVVLLDTAVLFGQPADAGADGTDFYILNGSDELVYASQDAEFLDWSTVDWTEETIRLDQGVLVTQTGAGSGWHYAALIPYNLFFRQNRSTVVFLALVFVLYLAVGLVLAWWLSKRNYQPVRALKELAASGGTPLSGGNEYDMIHNALLQHMESTQAMRSVLERQQPVVLRDSLARLLRRQVVDIDAAQTQLQNLGVEFETDQFLCAMVAFNMESPFFAAADIPVDESLATAKFIVENVGCELLGDQFQCYKLDMFNNQSLFILCAKKTAAGQLDDSAAQRLESVMDFALRQFELELICGVSQPETGLTRWPMCFEEAEQALECARYDSQGRAACFRLTVRADNDYVFPKELEQRLSLALCSADQQEAHRLLGELFRANFAERRISRMAAGSFLYQLTAVMQQAATTAGAPFREDELQKVLQASSVTKAQNLLELLIDRMPQRQESGVNRTEKLVDRIAAYIDEHADSKWLDLNTLSQEFGVTPQYISNIFKKQRDENVKDHISKRKLACAKELMRTTDLSIREIAARLGYASETSIIRMFRKYEGITPGEYRSRYGKHAD